MFKLVDARYLRISFLPFNTVPIAYKYVPVQKRINYLQICIILGVNSVTLFFLSLDGLLAYLEVVYRRKIGVEETRVRRYFVQNKPLQFNAFAENLNTTPTKKRIKIAYL